MKFVLVEVIERDISTPEFFNTKEEAYTCMADRIAEVLGENGEEVKEKILNNELMEDCYFNNDMAYISDYHGNNYDWKIFEI